MSEWEGLDAGMSFSIPVPLVNIDTVHDGGDHEEHCCPVKKVTGPNHYMNGVYIHKGYGSRWEMKNLMKPMGCNSKCVYYKEGEDPDQTYCFRPSHHVDSQCTDGGGTGWTDHPGTGSWTMDGWTPGWNTG